MSVRCPGRRPSAAPAGASFAGTLLPCPGPPLPGVGLPDRGHLAIVPASVPAAGFNFWVPARAVGLGIFTASSKAIAVEEASRFHLILGISQRGRGICAKRTVCAQRSRGDQPTVSSAREGFSIQTASTKDFNCEFRRNRSSIPLAWSPLVK